MTFKAGDWVLMRMRMRLKRNAPLGAKTSNAKNMFLVLLCLLVCFASSAWAGGVTYPDGTVSPFPPAFIPMGVPAGADESVVHGVAAKDGVIYGAVGYVKPTGGAETGAFLDKNGALSF